MLHYNNNSEESSKCLSKLYELLVNILIQEGITRSEEHTSELQSR